jgi:hypothetical protein
MDYLVGYMSYISFCVTNFQFDQMKKEGKHTLKLWKRVSDRCPEGSESMEVNGTKPFGCDEPILYQRVSHKSGTRKGIYHEHYRLSGRKRGQ